MELISFDIILNISIPYDRRDLRGVLVWKIIVTESLETGNVVRAVIVFSALVRFSFDCWSVATVVKVTRKSRRTKSAGTKTTERAGKAVVPVLYSLIVSS